MTTLSEKLKHNYHELTSREKLHYWLWDRWFLPREDRFFFEGHWRLPGQMYIADRKALFKAILHYKPKYCFEIGTFFGGGSTFFLAHAFKRLGQGKVVTSESNEAFYTSARRFYRRWMPNLLSCVEFLFGNSTEIFLPYVEQASGRADCVFLDGSDNAEETVEQYEFFRKYMRPGSVLMAHDWNTDKMEKLRPLIENDKRWHLEIFLKEPESVGFVVFVLKDND